MTRHRKLSTLAATLFVVCSSSAYADDVDVSSFEYVDVVETVEGSIWKGVVTEQTPNVQFKIATADGSLHVISAGNVLKVTKQRNPKYRAAIATKTQDEGIDDADDLSASLPTPYAKSGIRIEPELAIVFPRGDLVDLGMAKLDYRASMAPGFRIGYETLRKNIGLSVGGLARFTSWRLPVEVADLGNHWTLETQLYGRAALHAGRLAPYAGISLGLDTNHSSSNLSRVVSTTATGFGMNLQTGIAIAASSIAVLELGLDFHPGTDTIDPTVDASISYYALRIGASLRL